MGKKYDSKLEEMKAQGVTAYEEDGEKVETGYVSPKPKKAAVDDSADASESASEEKSDEEGEE